MNTSNETRMPAVTVVMTAGLVALWLGAMIHLGSTILPAATQRLVALVTY